MVDLYSRLKTHFYYRHVLGYLGNGCRVDKPYFLSNPRFVFLGDGSSIRAGARIEAIILDPLHPPSLVIGRCVNIEQNAHIICSSRILIGDNVTITGNCAIVDTTHDFQDRSNRSKIGERIDPNPTPVEIGAGTFIGFGSVILPNVSIGKECVIGANCTIAHDIPDYSVVSGNPARIVSRYDSEKDRWIL